MTVNTPVGQGQDISWKLLVQPQSYLLAIARLSALLKTGAALSHSLPGTFPVTSLLLLPEYLYCPIKTSSDVPRNESWSPLVLSWDLETLQIINAVLEVFKMGLHMVLDSYIS